MDWQCDTGLQTSCISGHALLIVDMDCKCMRIGSRVCTCTVLSSLPRGNLVHKLIHII